MKINKSEVNLKITLRNNTTVRYLSAVDAASRKPIFHNRNFTNNIYDVFYDFSFLDVLFSEFTINI